MTASDLPPSPTAGSGQPGNKPCDTPDPKVGLSYRSFPVEGPGEEKKGSLAGLSFGSGSGLLTIESSATPHFPYGLYPLTKLRGRTVIVQGTKVKVHVYFTSLILEMGLLFPHKLVLSL